MELHFGYEDYYKQNSWTPLQVIIRNGGKNLEGTLTASVISTGGAEHIYSVDVNSPSASVKLYTIYLYINQYISQVEVQLKNHKGKTILKRIYENPKNLDNQKDILLLSLSTRPANLISGNFGSSTIYNARLDPSLAPEYWQAYDSIDLLALADPSIILQESQQKALLNWIKNGGILLIPSGSKGIALKNTFWQSLLPVKLNNLVQLNDLGEFEDYYETNKVNIEEKYVILNSTPKADAHTLFRYRNYPLVVEQNMGRGKIVFTAFDVEGYYGEAINNFLKELLTTKGKFHNHNQQTLYNALINSVGNLPSLNPPSFGLISLFLLGYIIIIGPLNYIILKKKKKLELAWITIPIIVIVFSALAYTFAYSIKGGKLLLNEYTYAYIPRGGGTVEVHSFWGLFSPKKTHYDISLPHKESAITSLYSVYGGGTSAKTLHIHQDEKMSIKNLPINMWSLFAFQTWTLIDIPDGVKSDLRVENNRLIGILENKTSYNWENCLLVWGNNIYRITQPLKAGKKEEISIDITSKEDWYAISGNWNSAWDYTTQETMKEILSMFYNNSGDMLHLNGKGAPMLIGWTNKSLIGSPLKKQIADKKIMTVLAQELAPPKIIDKITLPANTLDTQMLEYNANSFYYSYDQLYMSNGYLTQQYTLPKEYNDYNIEKIIFNFAQTQNAKALLYNWRKNEWVYYDNYINLKPSNYIHPKQNTIWVKIESSSSTNSEISKLNIELVVNNAN